MICAPDCHFAEFGVHSIDCKLVMLAERRKEACKHVFMDSNNCYNCGVSVDVLKAEVEAKTQELTARK